MHYIKKKGLVIIVFILLSVTMISLFQPVSAAAFTKKSTDSYTYSIWHSTIPAPDAYEWSKSIRAEDLGIDVISGITDVFYSNDQIYIAMIGKIVITDMEFQVKQVITSYLENGSEQKISAPQCIFVTKTDDIYFTEEAMGVIIQLDSEGNFVRSLGDPEVEGLEGVSYAPTKVAVDEIGRIYVKAKSVYEGIIELDPDGVFNRFVGANEVKPSFYEIFKRMISTDEQISRMQLWLPTDYSDIALDKDGFLLATVKSTSIQNPIRKLNSSGVDIMNEYEFIMPPMGDYENGFTISTLTTIAAAEDGRFAVLDAARSRIFVYSEEGMLAYILGGSGKRIGNLNSPVDITFAGYKILVADLVACSIEVFEPTEYGALINEGLRYQSVFDYEGAAVYWEKVYDINPYSLVANMGLGKYQLRSEEFQEAMTSFAATGERSSYSAAYERVREEFLNKYFAWILLAVLLLIITSFLIKKVIRILGAKGVFENKRFFTLMRKLKYEFITWPGYIISHPFKAFDDVKYQNSGSVKFCFLILFLFSWAMLIKAKYSGFMVNYMNVDKINIPLVLISSVFPYILFIISNWTVGVLIDGKANMSHIFKVNMYALYPSIFFLLIGTAISKVIIYDEIVFAQFLFIFPLVIYVFYTFIGLLMTHQFSFTKGIVSILLSLVAAIIVIFILVLLVTIFSGFINDSMTIYDEILLYL